MGALSTARPSPVIGPMLSAARKKEWARKLAEKEKKLAAGKKEWANPEPEVRARRLEARKKVMADPEMRARIRTGQLRREAHVEAVCLYALIESRSCAIDDVRELIGIEPQTEEALRNFARYYGEESEFADAALRFRKEVGRRFEELLTARVASEVQEQAATECP
jgi:hypothetical protein